jgi:hypothetical protein
MDGRGGPVAFAQAQREQQEEERGRH